MAQNFADLGQKLSQVGNAQLNLGTYQPGTTFYADAAQQLMIALQVAFDAASSVTDIRVKLQGRHASWAPGVWQDIPTVKGSAPTAAPVAEQVFAVAAGTTISDTLDVLDGHHKFYSGGMQLVAKATGAGPVKAGDSATADVNAW